MNTVSAIPCAVCGAPSSPHVIAETPDGARLHLCRECAAKLEPR